MENYINFVKNRSLKKAKNSARFALWVFALILLIVPWANASLAEKIIMIGAVWVYLFFVLLYASDERMKDLYKKNRFYGWSEYGICLMCLYLIYRLQFKGFNWVLLTVLIVSAVLQTVLWILGVRRNIAVGNYNFASKEKVGFNFYVVAEVICHIAALAAINSIYVVNGQTDIVVFALLNCLYLVHCFLYLGLTPIYQNYIIKRHDLFYLAEGD